MNIAEILREHGAHFPEQRALVDVFGGRSRVTTFRELDQSAGRLAALLRQSGIDAGDTALVFQRMSLELYVALAAILRLGATAMFIDPSAGRSYIDRCCRLRPPRAMIASSRAHLLRLTTPALRKIPLKFSIGTTVPGAVNIGRAAQCNCDASIYACDSNAAALASFTSGTTGEPKVALRTHGFLLAQHRAIAATLALQPGEIDLTALPIFVLANLASRVTSVIPNADLRRPDSIDAAPLIIQITEQNVSRVGASPAFLEQIADYCERRSLQLTQLEKIFTGGGPVSLRLLDRLHRVAPHARVSVVYGSTEAEPITTISFDEIDANDRAAMSSGRGLLVGYPISCIDLRILRDCWGSHLQSLNQQEFEEMCQPAREPGEIIVRGDHVLNHYLDHRGDAENKLWVQKDCWHRTGDAGYLDECGRLWLLGRCSARIADQRGTVYPLGIEQTALEQEAIRRAAVVSICGKRVLAVELVAGSAKPDVTALLQALAFASVDTVQIVKRLPVDARHNAKIDYPALCSILERSA